MAIFYGKPLKVVSDARGCEKIVTYISLYLGNDARYSHSYYGRRIGNCTQAFEWCHFQWRWVTLSDLVKYSMTQSIAWSLCDSWASCIQQIPTASSVVSQSFNRIHLTCSTALYWATESTTASVVEMFIVLRVVLVRNYRNWSMQRLRYCVMPMVIRWSCRYEIPTVLVL